MLKKLSLKKIVLIVLLLGLPGLLFWFLVQKALDPTIFGVLTLFALGLAGANVWDQGRVARKKAMEEVDFARELMEKNQFRGALNRLEEALKYDPTCFEVRIARGEVYRSEQAYDKARRELVEAIQIRPDSFRAHFALGVTYLQEKKVFEAVSEFRRTIQIKPNYSEAHFILAQAYELAGEKGKALEAYKSFLKAVDEDDAPSKKIPDYVERTHSRILALQ